MKKVQVGKIPHSGQPEALKIIGNKLCNFLQLYDPTKHFDRYHITLDCKNDTSIIIKMLSPESIKPSFLIYAYYKQRGSNILMVSVGMTDTDNVLLNIQQLESITDILVSAIDCTAKTFDIDLDDITIITNLDETTDKTKWHRVNITGKNTAESLSKFFKWLYNNLGETTSVAMIRLYVSLYPHTIDEICSYHDVCIEKGMLFGKEVYNLAINFPQMEPDYRTGYTFEELFDEVYENISALLQRIEPYIKDDEKCELQFYCN